MAVMLETRGLTKAFYGITAVRDVSITVEAGQILGLVGQNGAGKSTLMNLIGGVVGPDSGAMIYNGAPYTPRSPADANAARIAFIHQELNLFTNLSIAENLFIEDFPSVRLGPLKLVDWATVRAKTREVLAGVGLDLSPDTVVDRISPGERQLVEIAKALYQDASLIILDEPTTSLTARETEKLFALLGRLRESGKALIYISHILKDVLALADSIAVMRDGALVTQEAAGKLTENDLIALMVGRGIEQLYPPRSAPPTNTPLLEARGVSAAGIVEDIGFTLHRGEVLGLFGLMGSGRTELARILFGLDPFERGEIIVEGARLTRHSARASIAHRLAFVTENRREEGLLLNISITDNVALAALPAFGRTPVQALDTPRLRGAAGRATAQLQLRSGDIHTQAAKSLSGGNQQKVVIAKWLLSGPATFIVDEPTRGIDVGAKHEIYSIIDQLAAGGGGILFISSELDELMGLCDRILVMSRGEIYGEFTRDQFDEAAILRAAFRQGAHGHNGHNGSNRPDEGQPA